MNAIYLIQAKIQEQEYLGYSIGKKSVRASAALAVPYYQKSVKTIKRWFGEVVGYIVSIMPDE